MGLVVNKSLTQVQRSIEKKADKLQFFLERNADLLSDKWSRKQSAMYDRLRSLSYDLSEEISYLDEIEIPGE